MTMTQQLWDKDICRLAMARKHRLAGSGDKYFTVELYSDAAPFTYSFTPYVTAGQSFWADWGDGSELTIDTASSTVQSHTYQTGGYKTVRMLGSSGINRVTIGNASSDNAGAQYVINSNGAWDKLGNITNGDSMFMWCKNALFAFGEVPENLNIGNRMFYSCFVAPLVISSIPLGMTGSINGMFANDYEALLTITTLPNGVTNSTSVFPYCYKSTIPIVSLPSNASVTSFGDLFRACPVCQMNVDNLVGPFPYVTNLTRFCFGATNVTGDAGAFVAKCAPGVITTAAFTDTQCTNIPA